MGFFKIEAKSLRKYIATIGKCSLDENNYITIILEEIGVGA